MRVGIGYDIHRVDPSRKLMLGGVEIPGGPGLLGHSDGDVLLHAIADALLGAMGEADLGELFPSADERYKNYESRRFIEDIYARLVQAGFRIVNVDAIVIAEAPTLLPHKRAMIDNIQLLLRLQARQVHVKAKTNDGLDAVGRKEAIAAYAVALIDAP